MSTPVKLRLYCSICARNDFYMDRIRAVADGLGLDYTLEKITDDDVIDRMDLLIPCLYAYCPGCRVLNEQVTSEHPETLCTPALEINGTLRFWGVPASDDALRQALSSLYVNKGRLPRPGEGGRSPKFYLTNRHKPHKINVKLF